MNVKMEKVFRVPTMYENRSMKSDVIMTLQATRSKGRTLKASGRGEGYIRSQNVF